VRAGRLLLDKPAAAVRRHRNIHLSGIGQNQRRHNRDELFDGLAAPEARVALAFLADRADMAMLVIVCRVDQRVVRQSEDLVVNRPVERLRIAALKIGSTAAIDQQGVARQHPQRPRLVDDVTVVNVGVPGRKQRLQLERAKLERLDLAQPDIGAGQAIHLRAGNFRAGQRAQSGGRRHVIRVNMGFDGISKGQAEFLEERQVAIYCFEDGINENRLAGLRTGQEIRVGG